ncbi:hypothetical protein LCGC14_2936140 [marine sediment metagenome]|uniref:Uncharacterized protein n=1 Tax=marine sediment metagenome TaxID=412755 RepID=A0A0F8XJB1_9ZZZZ
MAKQKKMKDILFEDLVLCGITHENAPPYKDCLDDCGVLKDRGGNPLGKQGGKHKKCMTCWEGYVDDLVLRIIAKQDSKEETDK